MSYLEQFIEQVKTAKTPEQRYESWCSGFTNPSDHNNERYRYLIHGLASPIGRSIQQIAMIEHNLGDRHANPINLEEEPEKINEKIRISASVIDEKRRSTWGDVGLILSTPPENIRGIYSADAGTPWYDDAVGVESTLSCTIEELLEQTTPGLYNEVVLTGTTSAGKVELVGFFVNIFADNDYVDPEMARKIRILSRHINLPLVEILDESPRRSLNQTKYEQYLKDRGVKPYVGELKIDLTKK